MPTYMRVIDHKIGVNPVLYQSENPIDVEINEHIDYTKSILPGSPTAEWTHAINKIAEGIWSVTFANRVFGESQTDYIVEVKNS